MASKFPYKNNSHEKCTLHHSSLWPYQALVRLRRVLILISFVALAPSYSKERGKLLEPNSDTVWLSTDRSPAIRINEDSTVQATAGTCELKMSRWLWWPRTLKKFSVDAVFPFSSLVESGRVYLECDIEAPRGSPAAYDDSGMDDSLGFDYDEQEDGYDGFSGLSEPEASTAKYVSDKFSFWFVGSFQQDYDFRADLITGADGEQALSVYTPEELSSKNLKVRFRDAKTGRTIMSKDIVEGFAPLTVEEVEEVTGNIVEIYEESWYYWSTTYYRDMVKSLTRETLGTIDCEEYKERIKQKCGTYMEDTEEEDDAGISESPRKRRMLKACLAGFAGVIGFCASRIANNARR
jgi:hypothetical protein